MTDNSTPAAGRQEEEERPTAGRRYPTRGFGSMTAEKKREIARKGGKAAHALGTAHRWTSEEAQEAGRRGGTISRRKPRPLPAQRTAARGNAPKT